MNVTEEDLMCYKKGLSLRHIIRIFAQKVILIVRITNYK